MTDTLKFTQAYIGILGAIILPAEAGVAIGAPTLAWSACSVRLRRHRGLLG
jgi:hypothetical protein